MKLPVVLAFLVGVATLQPSVEGDAHAAPVCGDGPIEYYEWQCKVVAPARYDWIQVIVGRRNYSCTYPYIQPLQGRTSSCYLSMRDVCGGGTDDSKCWYSKCDPKPTSYCGPVIKP